MVASLRWAALLHQIRDARLDGAQIRWVGRNEMDGDAVAVQQSRWQIAHRSRVQRNADTGPIVWGKCRGARWPREVIPARKRPDRALAEVRSKPDRL